ncbi:MAG: glycosyltransferase, partial [Pirellulales bacterium]
KYLARAVGRYLADHPNAIFLVVGAGESEESIDRLVRGLARPEQLVMAGCLTGQDLADAYTAIDVFAFSSQSETQGMVLAEAMAAGAAAVALDAPGAREIVHNKNGRLLPAGASEEEFARALAEVSDDARLLVSYRTEARQTARQFSIENCVDRMLEVYEGLVRDNVHGRTSDPGPWDRLLGRLEIEWNLLVEKTSALVAAATETEATKSRLN